MYNIYIELTFSNLYFIISEVYKNKALQNTQIALDAHAQQSIEFEDPELKINTPPPNEERPQPLIFQGNLKHYQLKGMNWLANLYDQVLLLFFYFFVGYYLLQ